MVFDVWDGESANIVGAFESQLEALDALERALDEHGSDYVSVLVLGFEDDAGDSVLIATGNELVKLVQDHRDGPVRQPGPNDVPSAESVAPGIDTRRT